MKIIGTGGLGTGIFFRLDDNRDIGRDESRPAHRLNQRDYCKQHIILHYLGVILRDLRRPDSVHLIGAVGCDAAGDEVLREMATAGLKIDSVRQLPNASTLSAVCYLFPDGSGGNLTESHSACAKVSPAFIEREWRRIKPSRADVMVLAAPEVPMTSRTRLLKLGRAAGAFNAASFVSQELPQVRKSRLLRDVDLVALNRDEAAALAGLSSKTPMPQIMAAAQRIVRQANPDIFLVLTAGSEGVYGFHRDASLYLPRLKVKAVNTAGAGDALLSGVMLGQLLGLPFIAGRAPSALRLGRALAAMKVQSPHTINFDVNLKTLRAFLRRHGESIL